jgi:hypothetical protein
MLANAKRNAAWIPSGESILPAARILNPRHGFFDWRNARHMRTGFLDRFEKHRIMRGHNSQNTLIAHQFQIIADLILFAVSPAVIGGDFLVNDSQRPELGQFLR